MNDLDQQQRFVQLRAQGWSFARISDELGISKPTLIKWSRKHQFDIQNNRAMLLEEVRNKWLSTAESHVNVLGEQLQKVEAELATRNVSELTTRQLFYLARALRGQIRQEVGPMTFSTPVQDIPDDDLISEVHDWKP